MFTNMDIVIEKDYRKMPITIAGITKYSFGKSENGKHSIWVAGQAGWYTVAPAPEYRTIYKRNHRDYENLSFLKGFLRRCGVRQQSQQIGVSEQVVFEKVSCPVAIDSLQPSNTSRSM